MEPRPEGNAAIEIHDSILWRIERGEDEIVIAMDAYIHRSPGRPGHEAGTGWWQIVELHLGRARTDGADVLLPATLMDGRVRISGETFDNLIPVPLDRLGPTRVELEGWSATKPVYTEVRLVIEGESFKALFAGPARFAKQYR